LFTKILNAPRKVIHRRLRGEIPKALLAAGEQLWNTYKGCEERATLGNRRAKQQPQRGCALRCTLTKAETPLGFWLSDPLPQGSSFLATLIVVPKLFIGGEESLWNLSPQPAVNNFAGRAKDFVNKIAPPERAAATPRWMTNTQPVSPDESAQSFAPARRLDSRRILRCRQSDGSAIRPSLSPSQRARNSNSTQRQS